MFEATPAARRARASLRNAFRHFVVLAAGLLIASVAGTAMAETKDKSFGQSGPYLGLSGLYQRMILENQIEDYLQDELEDDLASAPAPFTGGKVQVKFDDSAGLNALVGYRAASWFAVELEYEWVHDYDVDLGLSTVSGKANLYNIEGHTLTLNTKWSIPIWRIHPYILIGTGVAFSDIDPGSGAAIAEFLDDSIDIEDGKQTAWAGRFGAGVDFYLTQHIILNTRGSVLLSTEDFKTPDGGSIDDLNYFGFSAGLQYRF